MNERENNLMLKLENGEKSPFFIHSFIQSFKGVALTTHKEKPLITLTIPVKLILKAFEYTVALLGGAFISAMIVWVVTSNQGLTTCTFWGGELLGILAVLTGELRKRAALVLQQSREQTAVAAHPIAPVLTEYVLSTFQVSTH